MKTTIGTITTKKGLPADANLIWSHHVNLWPWIGMEAMTSIVKGPQE